MKHLNKFENSMLNMHVSKSEVDDMLGPDDLKYTIYYNKNGSGKVLNNSNNQFEFIFSTLDELCEGLQLRDKTEKYNL